MVDTVGFPGQSSADPDSPTRTPGDESSDLLETVKSRYRLSRDHFSKWRSKAKEDYDFVAGDQWSEEDKSLLAEQLRPVITFNRIGPVIDAVNGSEVANRQEVRYIPRNVGDVGVNELFTGAAKWVRDECNAEDEESDAFLDTVICGMGCTETWLDYERDPDGMIIIDRVDPLEMFADPAARKRNLTDRKWDMRVRMVPRCYVMDRWPDADIADTRGPWDSADRDASDPHNADLAKFYQVNQAPKVNDADKVALVHYQWFETTPIYRVADPATGKLITLSSEQHKMIKKALGDQMPKTVKQAKRIYKQAYLCGSQVLEEGDAPCQHGFSRQFMTGKRDRNHNTWFGLVRPMKDPQRWANKWLSQTLHIINSNAKGGLIAEKGAFDNPRKAEASWTDPSSITFVKEGGIGKIQPKPPVSYPAGMDRLMEFAVSSIRDVTGVNLELLGMANREQPGVLEYQRKQAGLTILAPLFDALRQYRKDQGKVMLYFIQEYLSDGRLVRIDGPEAQQYVPLAKDPETICYDVIVDEASTSPNMKEQVWAALQSLLPVLSKMGIPLPPDLLDYAPIPSSLAAKWKQMLSAPKPPDPTKQAEAQKMAADANKAMASAEESKSQAVLNIAEANAVQQGSSVDQIRAFVDTLFQTHGAALAQDQQRHEQTLDHADMLHSMTQTAIGAGQSDQKLQMQQQQNAQAAQQAAQQQPPQ